jgi:saccharopine dehydrogenase-like NADP-dependent oxidoreductase
MHSNSLPFWSFKKLSFSVFGQGFKIVVSLSKVMKVLFLGCGNIGSVAVDDFAKSVSSVEVFAADKNVARAKAVAKRVGTDNVSWVHLDVSNYSQLVRELENFDLVVGFLPGSLGYQLVEACVEVGRNLVDVSFMSENPLTLNSKAVEANVTIVPDCGLAPGISNILVGHTSGRLDRIQKVHIFVGGLPEKPLPPLGYVVTWSTESLVDEYTREARIVEDGKIVDVEALSGLEKIEFSNIGELEAFYTDGLRTLLHTMNHLDSMWEKTLRYPGHAKKVGLFKTLGFFDENSIKVEGVNLSPKKFTAKLLEKKLCKPKVKDIVALKIDVSGVKECKQERLHYHMFDRYDEKQGITAMARTTAYPASIIAQLILKKTIKEKGVVPPEKLGMNEEFFKVFLNELDKRGVKITKKEVVG